MDPDPFPYLTYHRLWSIAPPFGQGGMTTPSPFLHHSHSPYLSLRHWQTPQTRLAPPKAPQPLVYLVDDASLPALLLGDVCTAVWDFAALQVTETVLDGQRRVSAEKQGHQGHSPQHSWDGAHIEGGRWRGLVQLYNATSFHQTWTEQVQQFEGAVEHQWTWTSSSP